MPHLTFGGAERLVSDLARHLAGLGHRVVVAVLGRKPGEEDAGEAWFAPVARVVRVVAPAPELAGCLTALADEVQADGLVLIGLSPAYGALPHIRRLRPDLRIVSFQFNEQELTREHAQFGPLIDLLVAEGDNVAELLIANGAPAERIVVIPSGPDLARLDRDAAHRPADPFGLAASRRPIVGFVGRMDPIKAPLAFVSLCGRLRQRDITFVMRGEGPIAGEVKAAIARDGLARRIRWLDRVDQGAMGALYRTLDIVVVPSLVDGRPLVVQEAQACGAAVVASRVGSIPELIEDGVSGLLCDPGDAAAFAAAVTGLVDDPERRGRVAAAGRRRARREGGLEGSLACYVRAILGE